MQWIGKSLLGGQISMQKILGAESAPRSCFAHTAILFWPTLEIIKKRGHVAALVRTITSM